MGISLTEGKTDPFSKTQNSLPDNLRDPPCGGRTVRVK